MPLDRTAVPSLAAARMKRAGRPWPLSGCIHQTGFAHAPGPSVNFKLIFLFHFTSVYAELAKSLNIQLTCGDASCRQNGLGGVFCFFSPVRGPFFVREGAEIPIYVGIDS